MIEGPNTPERLREIRKIMEAKFGPDITKGSLKRMLSEAAFEELYEIAVRPKGGINKHR